MKGFFVSVVVGLELVLAFPAGAHQRIIGPDALLTGGDLYRQEQALQNALEYNKTTRSLFWMNPETGHRGTVTPIFTYKNSVGQDCRRYERSLTIDGRAAVAHGTRCRTRNGVWKIPRLVSTHWDHDYRPYYHGPYYPYYYRPYYPFTIHLGYYFGHFSGHHWHRRHRHH